MNSLEEKKIIDAWEAQIAFNHFLNQRRLFDETSSDFGQNILSKRLENQIGSTTIPFIIFSCIPKPLYRLKSPIVLTDFKNWLNENKKGYEPMPRKQLFDFGTEQVILDGFVFSKGNREFFEISKNGILEVVSSKNCIGFNNDNIVYLTPIIEYEMLLLSFIKRFYTMLQYDGELLFQLSFVNILNFKLLGLYKEREWYFNDFINKYYQNFKIVEIFKIASLDELSILNMTKSHSETICSCFGSEKELAFNAENKLNTHF